MSEIYEEAMIEIDLWIEHKNNEIEKLRCEIIALKDCINLVKRLSSDNKQKEV